jgi:hypothetical protein
LSSPLTLRLGDIRRQFDDLVDAADIVGRHSEGRSNWARPE